MTPDPLVLPAFQRFRAGDMPGTLAAAEAVLQRDGQSLPALGLAALAALRLGDRARAEDYLRRQLALAPGDRSARSNLATLLAETGRPDAALDLARDHGGVHRLARLAGYLHQQRGDLDEARAAYEAALVAEPGDAETLNNLGNVRAELGDIDGAAVAFDRAIGNGLSTPLVFRSLCHVLRGFERRGNRLAAAREGHARFPADAELHLEYALALALNGEMDEAETRLGVLMAAEQGFGPAHVEYGLLLENLNRLDELDAFVADCRARGLDGGELAFLAAWSLRRRDRFAEAQEQAARIPPTISPIRAAQLQADIAERLGDADAAFTGFAAMNAAAAHEFPAPAGPTFREKVVASLATFDAAARLDPVTSSPDDPVAPGFIVGFPRSGTTLLDTLLMAMPQLEVFEEQPMLALVRNEFPDLPIMADPAAARAAYWRHARVAGKVDGRRVIDKNPLHMAHTAEIHRLFPDAPIVFVERHPCDVVLSCFMANFVLNHAMRSFVTIEEAARTYDAVFTAWERGCETLPLRVHRVRYERMVGDLAGEMRPLLDFLGLPWRDEVLDNQKSAAARGHVRTASYAQVGQPIYGHARERWRRYRPQLEPVLPLLAPWAEKMGYDV